MQIQKNLWYYSVSVYFHKVGLISMKKAEAKRRRRRILNHLIVWQDNRYPSFDIQLFIANSHCVHLDSDPNPLFIASYDIRYPCFEGQLFPSLPLWSLPLCHFSLDLIHNSSPSEFLSQCADCDVALRIMLISISISTQLILLLTRTRVVLELLY